MDDFTIVKKAWIIAFRDKWFFENNKINSNFKAYLKKVKIAKQKQQVKLDKTCQKA